MLNARTIISLLFPIVVKVQASRHQFSLSLQFVFEICGGLIPLAWLVSQPLFCFVSKVSSMTCLQTEQDGAATMLVGFAFPYTEWAVGCLPS